MLSVLMVGFPKSISEISSFQLLIAGGLFLGVAAFMMALSRERRVSVRRSVVSDELTIQLARIADALEWFASNPNSRPHVAERVQPNSGTGSGTGADIEQPHSVSYSMFGR